MKGVQRIDVNWEPGHVMVGKPRKWMDVEFDQQLEHLYPEPIRMDVDDEHLLTK